MPWSYLEIKQPTWALFAFVRSHAGYNTDKRREETKTAVKLVPSYDVLNIEDRQRKPSGNSCVQARERSFSNSSSDSCLVLKLLSHQNLLSVAYSSKPFPASPWFIHHNREFGHKTGVTRRPQFRMASQSLGKRWQKDNEMMYSHPEASCPKSVNELLKDWHSFQITLKPRQQFHNISESKQKRI